MRDGRESEIGSRAATMKSRPSFSRGALAVVFFCLAAPAVCPTSLLGGGSVVAFAGAVSDVSSSRLLPRSPLVGGRFGGGAGTSRQRLDALLAAELAQLEKKLEEGGPDVRQAAQVLDQVKKLGAEKLSRKRGGGGSSTSLSDPGTLLPSSSSSGAAPGGTPNVLKDTVTRLVDEIEISKLKEALLEEKLGKLEARLEEESLAKALLLARVPSLFESDRTGASLIELVNDEEPLITKGDVADYCHFNTLKQCGYRALKDLGKMDLQLLGGATSESSKALAVAAEEKTAGPNDLPIWERCQIKDDFLSCMIAKQHDPCEPNGKATLSRKALHEFRRVLMKALQQAKGCWLPK